MIELINKIFPKQPPEKEEGNKEYKRILKYNRKKNYNDFIQNRSSQMLYRLIEGNGKAIYLIGLDDNGQVSGMTKKELVMSIILILKISNNINARLKKIRIYIGGKGYILSIRIYLPKTILIARTKDII